MQDASIPSYIIPVFLCHTSLMKLSKQQRLCPNSSYALELKATTCRKSIIFLSLRFLLRVSDELRHACLNCLL